MGWIWIPSINWPMRENFGGSDDRWKRWNQPNQVSMNLLPKEALPEYQVNADLKGVPISINEAGRKYKLNTSTLTRWMQRGLIHQLGKDGRKTLLDEADVAYCAGVYRQNSGQGKWAFDDAGRPYKR